MRKYFIIPSYITGVILITFGLSDDSNVFQFIRLFVFAAAFWCAFGDPKNILSKRTSMQIVIPMLAVMLLYNPIFPVDLDDFDLYQVINIATAITLIWCARKRANLFSLPAPNVADSMEKIRKKSPKIFDQIKSMASFNEMLMSKTIKEDTGQICTILNIQFPNAEIEKYTRHLKHLYLLTDDKSFDRMSVSIKANSPVDLNDEDCLAIYRVLRGIKLNESLYLGGDGTKDSPLVINANKFDAGLEAQQAWISERHGEFQKDWERGMHGTYDGWHEFVEVIPTSGEKMMYYFDISRYGGRY
jgi:hypothetical protein